LQVAAIGVLRPQRTIARLFQLLKQTCGLNCEQREPDMPRPG